MQTEMQTEMPDENRPEELPEGERPNEMPETEQGGMEPQVEPESPEIGQPVPGPDDVEVGDSEQEPSLR